MRWSGPPSASSRGPNARGSPTDSGLAISGTIPRSRRWKTAGTTSPSRPSDSPPKGEIGRFRFPPMVVAEVEICGGIDLELRALQWLYGTWLPRSGYVPDDHPGFEAWIGRPFAHGTEYFEIHVQLPIRRP